MRRLLFILLLGMMLVAPALGQQTAIGDNHGKDVDSIIKDPKNDNSTVQANAAESLGLIDDTRAVEPLILALKDNDSGVRYRAAEALGEINDTRAVEPLILALKDNDSGVRRGAAQALGEINDTRSICS